jgi:hypothetical protein
MVEKAYGLEIPQSLEEACDRLCRNLASRGPAFTVRRDFQHRSV